MLLSFALRRSHSVASYLSDEIIMTASRIFTCNNILNSCYFTGCVVEEKCVTAFDINIFLLVIRGPYLNLGCIASLLRTARPSYFSINYEFIAMENSVPDKTVTSDVVVQIPRQKMSSRANSVPILKVDSDMIEEHTAVDIPVTGRSEQSLEDDDVDYSEEEESRLKLLDKTTRSVGTSVQANLDAETQIDMPTVTPTVESSCPKINNFLSKNSISTSTCTADDEISGLTKTITPATILIPNPKDALRRGSSGSIAEDAVVPPRDKTQMQDRLLANLGPVPKIVKTLPSDKKKKRSLLSRFFPTVSKINQKISFSDGINLFVSHL